MFYTNIRKWLFRRVHSLVLIKSLALSIWVIMNRSAFLIRIFLILLSHSCFCHRSKYWFNLQPMPFLIRCCFGFLFFKFSHSFKWLFHEVVLYFNLLRSQVPINVLQRPLRVVLIVSTWHKLKRAVQVRSISQVFVNKHWAQLGCVIGVFRILFVKLS